MSANAVVASPEQPPVAQEKASVKATMANHMMERIRIGQFKGASIIERDGRWYPMTSDMFAAACYKQFGFGINKSRIADLEHLFRSVAEDYTPYAHYIDFNGHVWNMKTLARDEKVKPEQCVYRVNYIPRKPKGRIQFVLDLACGDTGVYDDIMQSLAPIVMDKKPTGVIWYLGGGANGKSTLVHLVYKVFGLYLTEITVKQLEDERDTPQLNGKLANICKESSEGFIEDTRTYKSIGTHESFQTHKFHSQDMVTIDGNVHHIFSANNIPTFGDKSYGARRRTLVIPFANRFKPDETFEERTFTDEFVEEFLGELLKYAQRLKKQNYEYEFSATTVAMKEKYDTDANTAQTYIEELLALEAKGFLNFRLLYSDYDNWSAEHGYKPSSINVLRRAADDAGFVRRSVRVDQGRITKMYVLPTVTTGSEMGRTAERLGIYFMRDAPIVKESDKEQRQQLLEGW